MPASPTFFDMHSRKNILRNTSSYFRNDVLDILRGMIQEAEESGEAGADLLAVIETGKKLTSEIQNPAEREQISISEIFQEEKRAVVNEVTEAGSEKTASAKAEVLYKALEDRFMNLPQEAAQWELRSRDNLMLKPLDFVLAAFYGRISEAQMYRRIFDPKQLRSNLQNLFLIYRVERYPAFKQLIKKYGLEEEKLDQYVRTVANTVAEAIVRVECKRGDSLTPYSGAVTAIEFFYGCDHLIKLLMALGKDKFVRSDGFGYNSNGSRKVNLCHLISVCHPLPTDTVEDFRNALQGTSIGEKRLIEVAMYAPQWIDLIEEYLGFTGLKSGAYYFMAHMNDQYNRDQRKFAAIARFTPLEKEELFNGAFDIA